PRGVRRSDGRTTRRALAKRRVAEEVRRLVRVELEHFPIELVRRQRHANDGRRGERDHRIGRDLHAMSVDDHPGEILRASRWRPAQLRRYVFDRHDDGLIQVVPTAVRITVERDPVLPVIRLYRDRRVGRDRCRSALWDAARVVEAVPALLDADLDRKRPAVEEAYVLAGGRVFELA